MAYNNGFPIGYQPYYQQIMPQVPTPQAQPQNNSIIWVQGEAGAKSYMVAPNTTVQLWDSEEQVIYLKSADASGMPSMKILDYKIREQNQPASMQNVVNNTYATRDELNALRESLEERLKSITERRDVHEQPAV